MDSTPAATYASPSPARIAWNAIRIVCRLDAQNRFPVVPGTVSGSSASKAARRPRFIPCFSCGNPHPTITSTISLRSSSGTCFNAASMAKATRSSGRASTSDPLRARPIGVRVAATITASGIGCSCRHVDDLTDERRLLLAFDLDSDADVPDDARPAPLRTQELPVQADARARRHRAREADLLGPVVDAHDCVADRYDLAQQHREHGQGQVPVRNGRAERAVRRSVGIDVDPLVVPGRLREEVDLLLRDLVPLARSELALAGVLELRDRQLGRHLVVLTPSSTGRRPGASTPASRAEPLRPGGGRGAPAAARPGPNARRSRTIPLLPSPGAC